MLEEITGFYSERCHRKRYKKVLLKDKNNVKPVDVKDLSSERSS